MSPKDAPGIDPASLRKILLIRLRRIGDVVMTTPAVRALRSALPQAEIVYVVEEPCRRLVEGNPDLDEVIVVEKGQTRRAFLGLVRRLRKRGFDAVLDFHGGPRASLLAFLSGAKVRVGYGIKYRSFLYDIRIPRRASGGPIHSVENHVNLVRALGLDVPEISSLILPDPGAADSARVEALLAANGRRKDSSGSGTNGRLVVLHIGAGNRLRDWGSRNLAELARRLDALPGIRVVLAGGPEDRAAERAVLEEAPGVCSLVGRLDLAGTAALISRAALFAGPDSGPMHMAAALGTPIAAWFGPGVPENFGPWKPRASVRIVQRSLDCRPCRQKDSDCRDVRCLRSITPDEVFEACRSLLRIGAPEP